jgi:hypothetical protein
MSLTDAELANLQGVSARLASKARTASPGNTLFEFTMELESHLQPGLRIRAPRSPEDDPDSPPFPLDLLVGIPLPELQALAHADDAERDRLIAHFGASFSPRLLRAIQQFEPHEIDFDAGCQSAPGTPVVMLAA